MSLSELFNEDTPEVPEPVVEEIVVPPVAEVAVRSKPVQKPVEAIKVVPAVSYPPVSEERAAQRYNTILRRFLTSGYHMEVMLGKFCVRRHDIRVTGWHGSFTDAITEITPTIMDGANYPDIGRTPYQEIGELKSLLQYIFDARDADDRPLITVALQTRITQALKE